MKDHFIDADILLPRVDQMARGHIVAWSHDTNGNVIDRAHANHILDTRMYKIKFVGGEVTIAESMYAQCDADGNEYLLLALLI